LEANCQITERQTKENLENGEEYTGLIETPYQNMMLDRQVLKTEEKLARHMSILSQEVVRRKVWTSSLQKKHNYK
jgi:hypothetical protein